MTEKNEYSYSLPELQDELKFAQTAREKAYLEHITILTDKIKRDFSTGLLHKEEFDRRRTENGSGIYIFVDGDGLKKINDITQDHLAGDAAIKALARGIQESLQGKESTVARAGGDEFVIFIEDASISSGVSIASKILQSIKQQEIRYSGTSEEVKDILSQWPLSASIGVGRTREEADKAMYQAKQNGRDRVEYFKPQSMLKNVAELALRLRKIGRKELSDKLLKGLEE